MKKIMKYITLIIVFGMVGCNDFLTVIPESNYSATGSYRSQMDFEKAIAAIYAQQQELYRPADSWLRAIIVRSDEVRGAEGYLNGLSRFTDGDNVTKLTDTWRQFWVIIYRSNMILDKIDLITFENVQLKNYIKGEAYVLRGYAYWNLAWQFGGMPLITQAVTVEETRLIPRSTQAETFALAEEDLKNAFDLLPEEWSGTSVGRATKYAAAGMLSRLLLFQSRFSEAKPYLSATITSGKYKMEENYIDCFTDAGDNGPERVWDIQFTGGQLGEGQQFATGMLPEGVQTDLMPFGGYSVTLPISKLFVSKYEPGDLRKDVSTVDSLLVRGVPDAEYRVIKYSHYVNYMPKEQTDWANNIPILRYTDILMMYAEVLNEESYTPNGDAFDILNNVRERAGLTPLTSEDLPDQISFRNAIIKERAVEFAFEGLRWPDLIRWGIAKQVMDEFFMDSSEGGGLYFMEDFRVLFAIPADELNRYNDHSVMWQNPGY
jgi:hypothetical protein